jgi:hypothetical protein
MNDLKPRTFATSFRDDDEPFQDNCERYRGYGRIEGYARALDDLMLAITGDSHSMKSYDPMTIEVTPDTATMHSYAFNLKDGGRHHPMSDYSGVAEVCQLLLREMCENLQEEGVKLKRPPPIDLDLKAKE